MKLNAVLESVSTFAILCNIQCTWLLIVFRINVFDYLIFPWWKLSECLIVWVTDWTNGWVSEWASERMNECRNSMNVCVSEDFAWRLCNKYLLRGCQMIDKVGQLLWPWFSFLSKSTNKIVEPSTITHGRFYRLQLCTISASFVDTQQQNANRKMILALFFLHY